MSEFLHSNLLKCKKLQYSDDERDFDDEREELDETMSTQKMSTSSSDSYSSNSSDQNYNQNQQNQNLEGEEKDEERNDGSSNDSSADSSSSASASDSESPNSPNSEEYGEGEEGEDEGDEGECSDEWAEEGDENEDGDEEEGEDEGEEGGDDDYEDDYDAQGQCGSHVYSYNTHQVVDFKQSNDKLYATEFYRFVEYFAEEKTRLFDHRSADEINIKKLMFRPFERRPLSYYKQMRVKDSVILILDNSGSMDWWARNLQMLASIALARNDILVYIAPNGWIEERLLSNHRRRHVAHDTVLKTLTGRRIIYVGDFDGADTPIQLSWSNDVIWICPETRYRRFQSHDWVNYDEKHFKGVFIRAWDLCEMFEGLKKVTRFYNLWIDFHEGDCYDDDGW